MRVEHVLLIALFVLGTFGVAFGQNMSQMGMAPYANPPKISPPPAETDMTAGGRSGPYGTVTVPGNPMTQVCPTGWGYGPTVSGTKPICVAP